MTPRWPPLSTSVSTASASITRPRNWPTPWLRVSSGSSLSAPASRRRLRSAPTRVVRTPSDHSSEARNGVIEISSSAQASSQPGSTRPASTPRPSIHQEPISRSCCARWVASAVAASRGTFWSLSWRQKEQPAGRRNSQQPWIRARCRRAWRIAVRAASRRRSLTPASSSRASTCGASGSSSPAARASRTRATGNRCRRWSGVSSSSRLPLEMTTR